MANPFDQMAAEEAARQPAEAPRDNPFTAMAQQERAERDSAMRVALDQALRVMPEQAANDNQVAKGLGLPVALVERNRDETTRMWKARELQAAVSASPVLERQLFDPQFAKLAHDDVGNLSTLEAALRLARDTGSALLSAGPTLAAGVWGGVRAVGDVLGPAGAPISASAGRQAAAADALAKGLMPKADSVWGAGWYSGVQSFGLNMLQMPLALLPGGQSALGASVAGMPARMTPLLASMGLVTGGGAYQQAREQGVSVPQALAFGASQGAIEAGTEALGMPALFSLLKPGKFGAKAVEYLLKEQGGEQLATLGQDLNEWAVLPENKAKTFADYLQERPSAALQTAIATAVGGGAQAATVKGVGWIANRAEYQAARAQQAEAHGQLIQQLNELASASKVLARSPEDFQQFVKEASADSPLQTVYVDGNVLHQSGLAEPLAQAAPELAADIQQAVETGGAVAIPVDQYLTRIAPTPLAQQLADHLRTEPDGYSRAEAQQFMATEGERLQADLERTIADAEQGDAFRASADAVRDSIKTQLDTANRFRPEVNDAYSRIVGAYFATRAAQLGITPEEMHQRSPLRVAAEGAGGVTLEQAAFHGSPHRGIEQTGFQLNKIGTGEGNQSYGWGLYFAGARETAEEYRQGLSWLQGANNPAFEVDGVEVKAPKYSRQAEALDAAAQGRLDAYIATMEAWPAQYPGNAHAAEFARTALEAARPLVGKTVVRTEVDGQLYSLEVPEDNELLDWDKKLSEQTPAVLDALARLRAEGWQFSDASTGEQFYGYLAGVLPTRGPRAASEFLLSKGIPGLRYLDGNSRSAGEGTHNYVVWDESRLTPEAARIETYYQSGQVDGPQFEQSALRDVDVFGNGSRVDHYDDKKGLMYSAQRFPGGIRWTVFETFPAEEGGNQVLGDMFKYKSLEEAQAAVRGLRISATQKATNAAKYGAIPNLWKGEEKKVAKALIDAGVGIERFASSTQSRSKYLYLNSGLKVRIADHALPGTYDQPDVDYRYGGDIKALVEEVVGAQLPTDAAALSQGEGLDALRAQWDAASLDHAVSEANGIITLSKIVVPESARGAGAGTQAMQALVDYADRTGQHIALTPSAEFGGNAKRLVGFYKRFGFVENKGRNRAFSTRESMYRQAPGRVLHQSALTPTQTDTPEFKRWFGGSKVVDAEGKPLVVYRGEGSGENFTVFDRRMTREKAFFFTPDLDIANTYAKKNNWSMTGLQEPRAFYLKAEKLFDPRSKEGRAFIREWAKNWDEWVDRQSGDDIDPVDAVLEGRLFDYEGDWSAERWRDLQASIEAAGYDGARLPDWDNDRGTFDAIIAFRPEQIKSATGNRGTFDPADANILRQGPRGSFNPEQLTISLLKGADLSTFLHESAHFFYENDIALAAQIAASQQQGASITAGEQQILADVGTLLTWHGLKGGVGAQLTEWYNLPFEQRRAHHERTAESFEAYLLEGKAPSIELAPYFQRFRSWLVRVYASLKDFLAGHPEAGTLTPEVRQVFDRMLATNDAIVQMEQARSMLPLFESAEQGGLSPEAWAQYQQDNAQQTQDAVQDLQARSLRDLQWARNARSRQLKRLQREANDLRKAAGVDAWREVMQQPVYRAWRFLTGKITEEDRIGEAPDASPQPSGRGLNPEVDSLLVAIAKLGGIARESAGRDLGVHADDQVLKGSVFGAPPFRKEGGLSADAMAERLLEAGYLLPDEHGKADLRELEELVAGELGGSPAYSVQWNMRSAMPEMQAGEQAVDPSQLGAGRLDKGSLGDMYGPSDARIAQLTGLRMTASKGALHPDIVAELFGFDSGDALVQALLEATPLREAVGAATDQIMLERHGELATPEAIEQAADRAVHNEARGRAVATELAALTKATGKPKLLADAARQFAAEAIARLKVRELIPSRFSNAQAKAARNAGDAMKAGDLARAAAEKRNELLQHYSARAAFDAREEVEKARKYLRKFDGEVKGLDPAYLSQITTLLGKYELRAHSLKDAERTVNLRAWVQSRLNDGEIPSLSVDLLSPAERAAYFAEVESRNEDGELVYQEDEDAIKLLADAIERSAKRSYKDLTVEEFRGLVDTVKNIEHLGRLKDTLLTARDQKSYEAVRNEMAAGIVAEAKTSGKNTPTATDWWGKKVQGIKGFLTSHIKAASWARVMDGGKDNGPVWRYLIQPANERATQETAEKARATEDLSAILGPILKDASLLDKSGKGRYFPSIGRSLNLQGRLAVALNYGNESNLQRLLGGDGWTQEQIMPVLQSLTAKEWQAVQAVWDYLESYWPRIVAKELRVTGKAPERIPARAFTVRTADGQTLTLRGGYFPVVFDPRTNMKADADAKAQEAKEMQRAAYSSATTRRSFTKQRVEELHGRPLLLSLQGLYSGVNDVIHDLAWHEWVLDANKLLKSKTIDAAIREHYGPEVKHELEKWRDDVVMNQRRLGHATERFVGFARQNISAAALSFSVWSAIQQPLGLVNSGARIGWHWLGRGVADYIASPFATTREVMEKSAWMQNRTRTRFRELNELRNTVQGQTAAKELMGRYGYWMMVRMQLLVDIPTWRGAYAKAVAEGHDERTAVNLADQGVKDAQGGGEEVDQAGVERGSAYAKLFTVFYSYMGSTLNTAYTSAKTDKNKARAAANILLIVTVPAILQSLLQDALTPGGDDDDDPEKLAKKLAGEQLSFLFGMFVGGREFAQTARGLFGGTGGFSGYSGPAGLRMVSDVDRLATQAKQGEFDEAFVKASISVLGDLSGLPSVQINRTITGVKAMAEGKTDNPLALAFGFQKQ